ncbi:uncharacterized protein LOC125561862 [Nematostella vectensis]|uniref:uncharacterized protein LOC125561862 n=1 Tax=Nematostella vectensis TaxID=45351 RepID=UPI00207743CE|nr:uncharacterized protein LOC125561862 [Nematostella vectensis]
MTAFRRNSIFSGLLIGIVCLLIFQFNTFRGLAFRKRENSAKLQTTLSVQTTRTKSDDGDYTKGKEILDTEDDPTEIHKQKDKNSKQEEIHDSEIRKISPTKPSNTTSSSLVETNASANMSLPKSTHTKNTQADTNNEDKETENTENKGTDTGNTHIKAIKYTEIPPQQIDIENGHIVRGFVDGKSFCGLSFDYGEMCPTSYVELGGKCDRTENGFDCPDIRNQSQYSHRQGQLITTRMMRLFDLIAKKHNISYWLTSGTLLGAARHRGNIPWDTDNDIDIPLADYIKFFEVAAKELPSDMFLQNSISDPYLRPDNKQYAASITHPKVGIYQRSWNPRLRDKKSCYKYCINYGCKWHDGMMIDMFVIDGKLDGIFPLKQMDFEGFSFPVPNNWKEQLSKSYGKNFMQVPLEKSKRVPVDFPDCKHSCKELGGN